MYFPYFRGKQYELLTVRESAELLSESGFVPIIEPVKESLSGLKRTLDAVVEAEGEAILIVNPSYGNHTGDSTAIRTLLLKEFKRDNEIAAGLLLNDEIDIENIDDLIRQYSPKPITFVHAGFTEPKALSKMLAKHGEYRHVFIEDYCGKLYQKHFSGSDRVLIRDGFQRRKRNRDHPELELFSDLHATYPDEGMEGFGDFLVVGDDFSEGGGPAYMVAIHLTFIDSDRDDQMFIHHFKSDIPQIKWGLRQRNKLLMGVLIRREFLICI